MVMVMVRGVVVGQTIQRDNAEGEEDSTPGSPYLESKASRPAARTSKSVPGHETPAERRRDRSRNPAHPERPRSWNPAEVYIAYGKCRRPPNGSHDRSRTVSHI